MNEEDKEIRNLFADFKPTLSPADDFMAKLDARLDAVEFIKQRNSDMKRAYRFAVWKAAVAGVIAGFIMGLIAPYITIDVHTLQAMSGIFTGLDAESTMTILKWLISCIISVGIAISVYQLDASRIRLKS